MKVKKISVFLVILLYFLFATGALIYFQWKNAPKPVPAEIRFQAVSTQELLPYPELENTLININTAGKEELMLLPGIGEGKAEAIMEHRTQQGLFESVEQLDDVKGIGEVLMNQLRPYITIEEPSKTE